MNISEETIKRYWYIVDLKQIYSAATEEAGLEALEEFGETWNGKYPMIYQSWKKHWDDKS